MLGGTYSSLPSIPPKCSSHGLQRTHAGWTQSPRSTVDWSVEWRPLGQGTVMPGCLGSSDCWRSVTGKRQLSISPSGWHGVSLFHGSYYSTNMPHGLEEQRFTVTLCSLFRFVERHLKDTHWDRVQPRNASPCADPAQL